MIQQWESELRERERGKMGEGEGPLKMPVENESWGPAQGEIQGRNTSAPCSAQERENGHKRDEFRRVKEG